MVRSWRPSRSSAATRSSNCGTRKRPWPQRSSSGNCTRTTCRAGKERARFARLPALEARVGETRVCQIRPAAMTAADVDRNIHHTILAVWRIEQPRLITGLSRMLRDVPLAEELTQEARLAALEHWPATGVPEKPGAWLMATAKRRALDHLRRGRMLARKHEMVARDLEQEQEAMPDWDSALDDDIGDELLRLIFTACHPRLSREARAALALRMICGLTTEEIARAFPVPAATIGQRIVRAKRTLSESGLAYETPSGEQLSERLASVLEVVYLIFNEGYTAARGEHWLRPQLCHEA